MNINFSSEAFNPYKAMSLGTSQTSIDKTGHANIAGWAIDRNSSGLPVKNVSDPAATISISNRMREQVMRLKYDLDESQTQLTNLQIGKQTLNDYGEKLEEIRARAQNFAQDRSLETNYKVEAKGLEVLNLMDKIKEGLANLNPDEDENNPKEDKTNLREDYTNVNQNNIKESIREEETMTTINNIGNYTTNIQREQSVDQGERLGNSMARLSSGMKINSAKDEGVTLTITSDKHIPALAAKTKQQASNEGNMESKTEGIMNDFRDNLQYLRQKSMMDASMRQSMGAREIFTSNSNVVDAFANKQQADANSDIRMTVSSQDGKDFQVDQTVAEPVDYEFVSEIGTIEEEDSAMNQLTEEENSMVAQAAIQAGELAQIKAVENKIANNEMADKAMENVKQRLLNGASIVNTMHQTHASEVLSLLS